MIIINNYKKEYFVLIHISFERRAFTHITGGEFLGNYQQVILPDGSFHTDLYGTTQKTIDYIELLKPNDYFVTLTKNKNKAIVFKTKAKAFEFITEKILTTLKNNSLYIDNDFVDLISIPQTLNNKIDGPLYSTVNRIFLYDPNKSLSQDILRSHLITQDPQGWYSPIWDEQNKCFIENPNNSHHYTKTLYI